MKIFLPISILLAALALTFLPACNADNEDEEWNVMTYSNVAVKSFKLGKNDSVLAHLDTVFFSIDLNAGRIFNADSLPMGTRVNGLTLEIDLPDVSKAMLYYEGAKGTDSIDYLTNSTDTVDFTRGPARLSLTSADGLARRDYTISVNVHRMNPDSLAWGTMSSRRLPSLLESYSDAGAAHLDGLYYCLTASRTEACMAVTDNLEGEWTMKRVAIPANASVMNLTAADGKLFLIDNATSTLYSSADGGSTWASTGARMSNIYGAYGSELLGNLRLADGSYVAISYPSATDPAAARPIPAGCPVSGTSSMIVYTTEWSDTPMAIFTGGLDATSKLSGASWGYDGTEWTCLSVAPGAPRHGMVMVPYLAYRTDEYWVVKDYSVLLAFGGSGVNGLCSNELWISFDRGIHWTQGAPSLQLPAVVPALRYASAFVEEQTLTAPVAPAVASLWREYPSLMLPSRSAIDVSWQCPYIYLLGGYDNASRLSTAIWRGAINRLTFRPLF